MTKGMVVLDDLDQQKKRSRDEAQKSDKGSASAPLLKHQPARGKLLSHLPAKAREAILQLPQDQRFAAMTHCLDLQTARLPMQPQQLVVAEISATLSSTDSFYCQRIR